MIVAKVSKYMKNIRNISYISYVIYFSIDHKTVRKRQIANIDKLKPNITDNVVFIVDSVEFSIFKSYIMKGTAIQNVHIVVYAILRRKHIYGVSRFDVLDDCSIDNNIILTT